jgi:Protein of unknown function (DUF3047)
MVFFISSCKLCVMLFSNVFTRFFQFLSVFGLCLGLSACSSVAQAPSPALETNASLGGNAPQNWQPMALPGKRKTQFHSQAFQGRQALQAVSSSSASMMRRKINVPAADLGLLQFSWQTPMLIDEADMAERDTEDAVVRVILSFEGDRTKFSAKNRMLSDLSHALTGEDMPYATLMYVWCNKRPVGSLITNPRTDRIRKMVVESGASNLGKWLDYERDIRADFIQAFGEEPGALTGIALMTDTDNTQSKAMAWYGPISFKPPMKTAIASKP